MINQIQKKISNNLSKTKLIMIKIIKKLFNYKILINYNLTKIKLIQIKIFNKQFKKKIRVIKIKI